MHELSLAEGILRIVESTRAREPFERVSALRLAVGALAGVEVAALRFGLEAIAPHTALAGARIDIDELPASAWCFDCEQHVQIRSRLDTCEHCGGIRLQTIDGDALRVVEMTVV